MALSPLGNGWHPLIDRVLAAFPGAIRADATATRESVARFLDLVVSWNQRMDLTAARSNDELVDLMLADAAAIAARAFASGGESEVPESWLDVGSGAGAPGVALALLAPEIAITLVEPRQKRVAFLRTALAELGLRGVGVERCRSSELDDRRCDVAVSRATLPPVEWLPEGARLAKSSVWVLLARDTPPALEGWQPDLDLEYAWPLTGAGRRAVRYVQRA
jgi:16S rRNA (guanine527-N7)-methyltransferase